MPEAVIKGIYDEASNYNLTSEKEKESLLGGLYYYFKLKKIAKKVDWSIYVEKNKEICNGAEVLIGTRIRPETIYYCFLNFCADKKDISEIINKIKIEYPTLDDKKILMSLIYVIKKDWIIRLF